MDLLLSKQLVYVSHPSPLEASVSAGTLSTLGLGQENRKTARSPLSQVSQTMREEAGGVPEC